MANNIGIPKINIILWHMLLIGLEKTLYLRLSTIEKLATGLFKNDNINTKYKNSKNHDI